MRKVKICDATMIQEAAHRDRFSLTFKEKTEIANLLDRIGVDVIELEGAGDDKADILRLKSICVAVKDAVISVPVKPDKENIDLVWNTIASASRKRLSLSLPVSTVQMEYSFRLKTDGMLGKIRENIEYMRSLADDVEFVAQDATRADRVFLYKVIQTAIDAGATTVTVIDESGTLLPDEFGAFVRDIRENVPELEKISLGAGCANTLMMAGASLLSAMTAGADELKTAAYAINMTFLNDISRVLFEKGEALGIESRLRNAETARTISRIRWMCKTGKSTTSAFDNAVMAEADKDVFIDDDSEEIPETYRIDSYTINTGSIMTSTAHIRLDKGGQMLEEVVMGDGPIDASFLAIERITGCHYELEDFQIKAIAEGREALGQTLVRLRGREGQYTGVGTSSDIIGACIIAYINALNKIVYKESER